MKQLVWLVVGILMVGCSAKSVEEDPDPETLRSELTSTEVNVVKSVKKTFTYSIETSGKIEASKQVELKFKVSGLIEGLKVVNGQYVKKGQVLAALEGAEFLLALKKAEVLLKQKTFQYENEILGYSGGQLDGDKGEKIKENLKHSTGLAEAEISYQEAKLRYTYTKIVAPISGVIANLELKEGSYVALGDPLCMIYSPNLLEVNALVLEGDHGKLEKELKATLKTIGTANQYEARLTEINPQVDDDGMVKVKLSLASSKELVPGMNVQLSIQVPKNETIVIPKDAVIIRSGREVVFVEENGLAKWNYVTVGLDNGEEVEILEGIKESENVIVTNNLQLAHDAPVSLVDSDE